MTLTEHALIITLTLLIATLAVWQIIEVWHHSHLMADLRARVDLWEGFFGQLLRCPFCLAPWVSLIVVIDLIFGFFLSGSGHVLIGYCLLGPPLAFATARFANLCNDRFHDLCRTPREDWSDDPEQ